MKKIIILFAIFASTVAFSQVGIGTQTPSASTILHVDAAKDNTSATPTAPQQVNDFVVTNTGSVGIGNASPDDSSILDMHSTNKGILIPRVDLTSNTLDLDGVAGQANGLLIYNTGSTFQTGFYYWNGTEWRTINNTTTIPPAITDIKCNTARLSPDSYTAGVPYEGIMTVTYSGGNGGAYSDGTPIASTGVTGLTATLLAGTLANGSGTFTYQIEGTPSASSPNLAQFDLPTTLGGTGCTAWVGLGNAFSIGETRSFRVIVDAASFTANGGSRNFMTGKAAGNVGTTNRRSAYELSPAPIQEIFPVVNGLRMDFLESPIVNGNVTPTLFNTTAANITYNISALSTNDAYLSGVNTVIAPNAHSFQIDGNNDFSCITGSNAEYVNAMLTFTSGEWYQLTYHATRDASNYYFYMTAQRLN